MNAQSPARPAIAAPNPKVRTPAGQGGHEFSLRALAREVWAEMEGPEYHTLAKEMQRRIRAKDRDAALAQALTEWARRFATGQRPSGNDIAQLVRPEQSDAAERAALAAKGTEGARGTANLNSARSPKVRAIREAWLLSRYRTADGQKSLRDCTRADVIFIANGLDAKARQNAAKAALMRELEGALAAQGVERVRDLPEKVLSDVLTRSAA
jgi:hypothetical protein